MKNRFKYCIYSNLIFQQFLFYYRIDLLLLILICFFWTNRSPFKIVVVILRIPALKQLSENIEQQLQLNRQQITIIQYLKLVSIIVIMSHIFGCMYLILIQQIIKSLIYSIFFFFLNFERFYYIGAYYNPSTENNWVHSQNLEDKNMVDVYIASFYWAIVTMASIGYGDIVPMNIYERIYVIFMVLVSNSITAYTINKIGEILDQYNIHEKQIKQKMMEITKQLNQASISKQLQIKINKQLEFLFFHQLQENYSIRDILQTLSLNLQCQYKIDVFGKFIKNQQVFNQVFSEEFLQEISLTVVEKSFMPEEIIFAKNSEPNQLYLILNGEIELNMFEMQGKQDNWKGNISIYKKGDILGYEEFISGDQRKNNATAKTVTNAGCIDQKQFLEIIQKFPKDHEIFCMMRDKLVIYKERNKLLQRLKCACCKQSNHDTQFCPLVHYMPREISLILKSQYSKNQERKFCKRRNQKQKAYTQINEIKCFINQLQQDSDIYNKLYFEYNSQLEEKKQDSLQDVIKELDKNFEQQGIKFSNNFIVSSKDIIQYEDQIKVLQFQKYKNKQKQPDNNQQDNQKLNYKSNMQIKTNDMNDDSGTIKFNTEKNIILQQQQPQSDFNEKDSIKISYINLEVQNSSLKAIEDSPKIQYVQNTPITYDQDNPISTILKNGKGQTIQSNGKIYIKTISSDQKKGISNDQILSSHLIVDDQCKMEMNNQQDELNVAKKVNFSNQLTQNYQNLRSKDLKGEKFQPSKVEFENEVFIGLDMYKNFVYYFPHNNLEQILIIYNKLKTKRIFKKIVNKRFQKR
ncbi:cation channel family transporter (macronuclear) [Tetrahymena thermophila SB210]|uniref:Cation channel family transporter n=1 Tax=Tetrahymena thermophila (strain SB210) TaxID=312017 RepID=W7XAR1_TETTS|nr:cation channel family transporter [Tetrahymena thermophila SB210]EWS76450.1 cation channel family transporter [Tetrahymena thermophila SB210]|eukprot:XP_012651016.1 cation channel family transporter [Tetrahymena thermophila SB210]